MSLQTPPPSCTGLDAVHGPTETKSDFTTAIDVPPLIEISADDFLQDEQRMKKLKAKFCNAIYAHADQGTIDRIIDESLKLCGGSEETLSTVLQTKFFVGHTPFYWAIVNKDPNHTGVPLLLEKLFEAADDLYRSIEPRLQTFRQPSTPSYFQGEGQQPTEVCLTFIAMGEIAL
ncbi:hypothetical protein FA13DRAFT_1802642 [Coprinellus micaceus]|uniref:Uncharacterized protein n=1 Tax=Coprinellus micaceus TaxID=71717 RepID=A0A4Y7SBI4_COPMI|nr:hypothetical protein FA13DRAFT_1802642 [Coprinellus micaceus]